MQNAKDEQATEVRIERHNDRLRFEHNGGPFQVRHQISLLNGNSSKSIAGAEPGKTGKFGTGFISTHILGERVEVAGVVTYNGQQARFVLPLDRRGNTPAELAQNIKVAEAQLRQETNLGELTSHKTSFTYFHDTERQANAAASGLHDLVNTLPFTLVTLAGQLIKLEIADYITKQHHAFGCAVVGAREAGVDTYRITDTDSHTKEVTNTRYVLCYAAQELQLLAEVDNIDTYPLISSKQAWPMLYWVFRSLARKIFISLSFSTVNLSSPPMLGMALN